MIIKSTAFENGVLNKNYGANASKEFLIDDLPFVSFDLSWEQLDSKSKYIHFLFIDYDAIPVGGKPWIHWCVANVDTSKLSGLETNASYSNKDLIQGITSLTYEQGCENIKHKNIYLGPMPPDKDHLYTLHVFTTETKLDLENEFYVSEFYKQLRKVKVVEQDEINVWYIK